MDYQFLKTETRDNGLIITMHDPATRNALGMEMANELMQALDAFENNSDQRVLLITGTEPSFCSGANVRGFGQQIQDREGSAAEMKSQRNCPGARWRPSTLAASQRLSLEVRPAGYPCAYISCKNRQLPL